MSLPKVVPRGRARGSLVLGLPLSLLSSSCIDTNFEGASPSITCPASGAALSNVVFLEVDLGELGRIRCSGVALTNTLIATALGCVMMPNEVRDRSSNTYATSSGDVFNAGAPGEHDCSEEIAVEDGSFSTQYGAPLPKDAIYVGLTEDDEAEPSVAEVMRAPATRCSGGLALLKLASRVALKAIPIRVNGAREPDEPVTLSYVSVGSNYTLERNDVSTTLSDERALPLSLDAPATCPGQSGAGVFSNQTGALLGLLESSLGDKDCSTPARGSVVRLGAFQHMLVDAAGPGELLAEPGSETPNAIACRY